MNALKNICPRCGRKMIGVNNGCTQKCEAIKRTDPDWMRELGITNASKFKKNYSRLEAWGCRDRDAHEAVAQLDLGFKCGGPVRIPHEHCSLARIESDYYGTVQTI